MPASTTAEPVTAERLRLAVHEAGHAVASVLLGGACDGVTMNDTRGLAFHKFEPPPPGTPLAGSMLLLDHEIRNRVERDILITLAGPVAADCWAPPETAYQAKPATAEQCERLARELEAAGLIDRI